MNRRQTPRRERPEHGGKRSRNDNRLFGDTSGYSCLSMVMLAQREENGMDMEYGFYLEQRYLHSTAMVVARLLTPEDAAALHYEDGFRGVGGDKYTTYVDGFETEEAARRYIKDLHNGVLLEGEALKDWDTIPAERGILTLTLTERERILILNALDALEMAYTGNGDSSSEEAVRQGKALAARIHHAYAPIEREAGLTADPASPA